MQYKKTALLQIREAEILCKYLIKKIPEPDVLERYESIIKHNSGNVDDTRLLNFALSKPWAIPFIDSASALIRRDSEVRRRIHIMFAVLESTPEYSNHFLAPKCGRAYIFVIGFVGMRAFVKAIFGIILIKALRA